MWDKAEQRPFSSACSFSGAIVARVGSERYLTSMSTLAEIEDALPSLSIEELSDLEQALKVERRGRLANGAASALDLPPLDLGQALKPFVRDEEHFDEMIGR